MSDMTGGRQPGGGGSEPPQVQQDPGSETGAGGPGDVAAVADLEARLAEAEDQKLRALADLDNLRKRCAGSGGTRRG